MAKLQSRNDVRLKRHARVRRKLVELQNVHV